ncbi:MAG TPA: cytochrome bd-I ubiquinol oxidase subunit CydA, partial [Klebsiella pneumoniae]|nr:cytochrome bd-I ubiquinol oxidase subunit CydA [Klebsiella pneumoniae]
MLDIGELSRVQCAMTAMYHVLLGPLTLGMAFLLSILGPVTVRSGYQRSTVVTDFWGTRFDINLDIGVYI